MLAKTKIVLLIVCAAAAITAVCFYNGCPRPKPIPPPPPARADAGPATRPVFTIKNECAYDIWIQQQGMPASTPSVVKLASRTNKHYDIPIAGLASTRFWVKTGCDDKGQNCLVGQSSPPCPPNGCAPPVDSKIEATWGCDLPESQCGLTPQGKTLKGPTWWDSSAVDGYTLAYNIDVGPNGGSGCLPVNCAELYQGQCPSSEDLSTDGKYPDLKSVDLHVAIPKPDGGAYAEGCYSPCMALTYTADGGKGYQPPSDPHSAMYCCPTPPISSPECKAGPVIKTKYVEAIHAMCHKTAYAFAYDDGLGLRTCNPTTPITMTYCPPQPAK